MQTAKLAECIQLFRGNTLRLPAAVNSRGFSHGFLGRAVSRPGSNQLNVPPPIFLRVNSLAPWIVQTKQTPASYS
jgi:hypothetical protein